MIRTCCKLGRQRHLPPTTSERARPRAAMQHQRHELTPQHVHALLSDIGTPGPCCSGLLAVAECMSWLVCIGTSAPAIDLRPRRLLTVPALAVVPASLRASS